MRDGIIRRQEKPSECFAIISDLYRSPSIIYGLYRSREGVEQVSDTMNRDLKSDKINLRESEKVKGLLKSSTFTFSMKVGKIFTPI